jgi:general nucleoside transport system permease protein
MTDSSPGNPATDAGSAPAESTSAAATDTTQRQRKSAFRRFIDFVMTANPFILSLLSFITALIVGAILIVLANQEVMSQFGYFFAQPGTALSSAWNAIWQAYSNLFKGALFDPANVRGAINGTNSWAVALHPIAETLTYATPLIFTGLAVAFAFRSGLFNIGAQGQAVMGGILAAVIGFSLHLPGWVLLPLALIGAIVGGGIWGFVPGLLKARTGAHEVIVTIMLNYIAGNFLLWIINQKGVHDPKRSDAISKTIFSGAKLPKIFGPQDSVLLRTSLGLILGLLAAALVAWLINRSTLGFELRAVGLNPDAARTAGMSVSGTYVTAMVISGALAGLGGAAQLLGTAYNLTSQVMGNIGFDGITVALLGRTKPWGTVLAAVLFGALYAGGNQMQSNAGVTVDLVNVLQAVIVLFIAAPGLIKAMYHLREDPNARFEATLARGW